MRGWVTLSIAMVAWKVFGGTTWSWWWVLTPLVAEAAVFVSLESLIAAYRNWRVGKKWKNDWDQDEENTKRNKQ